MPLSAGSILGAHCPQHSSISGCANLATMLWHPRFSSDPASQLSFFPSPLSQGFPDDTEVRGATVWHITQRRKTPKGNQGAFYSLQRLRKDAFVWWYYVKSFLNRSSLSETSKLVLQLKKDKPKNPNPIPDSGSHRFSQSCEYNLKIQEESNTNELQWACYQFSMLCWSL